jgi:hypothetical protein
MNFCLEKRHKVNSLDRGWASDDRNVTKSLDNSTNRGGYSSKLLDRNP